MALVLEDRKAKTDYISQQSLPLLGPQLPQSFALSRRAPGCRDLKFFGGIEDSAPGCEVWLSSFCQSENASGPRAGVYLFQP